MELRKCRLCKENKSLYEFHKNGKYFSGRCKSCKKHLQETGQWKKTPYDRYAFIERNYGMNKEQFLEFFASQKNKCKLCSRELQEKWCVDHCHTTGKIRGVLCYACNSGIGHLQEDPEILRKAIDYVQMHTKET